MKTYQELITFPTYAERLEYLQTASKVGEATFGNDRPLNQMLYHDPEWKRIRNYVISRDSGCDLAIPGLQIHDRIYIHHITPITVEDILSRNHSVFDINNLISCSFDTHNKIHYGIPAEATKNLTIRTQNDTCPWK